MSTTRARPNLSDRTADLAWNMLANILSASVAWFPLWIAGIVEANLYITVLAGTVIVLSVLFFVAQRRRNPAVRALTSAGIVFFMAGLAGGDVVWPWQEGFGWGDAALDAGFVGAMGLGCFILIDYWRKYLLPTASADADGPDQPGRDD